MFVRTLINITTADHDASRDRVLVVRVEPRGSNQRGVPGVPERLDRIYSRTDDAGWKPAWRPLGQHGQRVARQARVGCRDGDRAGRHHQNGRPTVPQSADGIEPDNLSGILRDTRHPAQGSRFHRRRTIRQLGAPVCIVNDAFVRIAFPDEDPIGKTCATVGVPRRAYTIVGVADDSRYTNPRAPVQPVIYTPFFQSNTGRGQMILYVRLDGDASSNRAHRAGCDLGGRQQRASVPGSHAGGRSRWRSSSGSDCSRRCRRRSVCWRLCLTAIGLHGLLSYLVLQRKRELAIRVALGARQAGVMALVAREAVLLVGLGAVVAVPLMLALARLSSPCLSDVLFGLTVNDAATIVAAVSVLVRVGGLAASLPAKRASDVDPMMALRAE